MTVQETVLAIQKGEMKAQEVLESHLKTIQDREEEINAFNLVMTEEAIKEAEKIDSLVAEGKNPGPLTGIPVAVKDNICTQGIPTTCSSNILAGWLPPYDATIVERLRDAGAVIVGKTNLDEFAMGASTENSAFGPTRNPLDTTRVPGGSSGGSAAAVAAGFTPLAIGSDTGGSIRQPAALCGVVGVKPTYGRVSRYGLVAFASSLDQIGPFAETVADAALLLEVISGHDPLDTTSIPEPPLDLSSALTQGVEGLRIGVIDELTYMYYPMYGMGILASFALVISPYIQMAGNMYIITNRRIIGRFDFIVHRESTIYFERIQNVKVNQYLLDNIFNTCKTPVVDGK